MAELVGQVWCEDPPVNATKALQVQINRLRTSDSPTGHVWFLRLR